MRKFTKFGKLLVALALIATTVLGTTVATYAFDTSDQASYAVNSTTGYKYVVDDRAGLLDTYSAQYQELFMLMSELTEYTNVIYVSTDDVSYSYYSELASSAAEAYIGSKNENTIVFSIDMKGRELYFYATGDVSYKPFNSSTCSTICYIFCICRSF